MEVDPSNPVSQCPAPLEVLETLTEALVATHLVAQVVAHLVAQATDLVAQAATLLAVQAAHLMVPRAHLAPGMVRLTPKVHQTRLIKPIRPTLTLQRLKTSRLGLRA